MDIQCPLWLQDFRGSLQDAFYGRGIHLRCTLSDGLNGEGKLSFSLLCAFYYIALFPLLLALLGKKEAAET